MNQEIDDILEQLIKTKSFEQLTLKEKEFVLKSIQEEDYIHYHELINETTTAFKQTEKDIFPQPQVYTNLLKAFHEKNQTKRVNWLIFPEINWSIIFPKQLVISSLILIPIVIATVLLLNNNVSFEKKKIVANNDKTIKNKLTTPKIQTDSIEVNQVAVEKEKIIIKGSLENIDELSIEKFNEFTQNEPEYIYIEIDTTIDATYETLKTMNFDEELLIN